MADMTSIVEPATGTPVATAEYPNLRGSAASVLAVPQADVPMSATAAAEPKADAAGAVGERQKKEESTLDTVDLDPLPDGFKDRVTVSDEGLALTQGVRSIEALVSKHHTALVLYRRLLREQAAGQAKLEARLKAMEVAVPAAAKQHAAESLGVASQALASADAADQRVGVLTLQLNEYAKVMDVFEKGQQEVLNQHLQTIEATFVKCDEVLSDVRASVASAPASSGTALAAPQQELGALRGHVDTLAAVIQATAVQAKDAEDATVLDRVKMNELTAWCNNSDQRHSAKVASQDATLRTELMTTFKMVRTEFDTLRAGLCKCPNGCAGREPQQASQ